MKLYIKYAKSRVIFIRSIRVSLVVGTVLAIINHCDAIIDGTFNSTNLFQVILTYLVPFLVATYGSVSHARHIEMEELKRIKLVKKQNLKDDQ
jgi:Mg/Co/Ni transporter MgtE